MKKNEVMAVVESRILSGDIPIECLGTKEDAKRTMRMLSFHDSGIKNAIFELGLNAVAKELNKR